MTILGCGTMGSAFARALSGTHTIRLYDRSGDKARELSQSVNAKPYDALKEALKDAGIILLAFKPKDLAAAAPLIEKGLSKGALVISLLSTSSVSQLQEEFPNAAIVRMMPNIAAEFGQSMTALCDGGRLADKERKKAEEIAKKIGQFVWISEDLMPGFIALAGSGPAFHLEMIEAMVETGIAMGFKPDVALEIVQQTLQSTSALLQSSDKHPEELRWSICTPGGTTIAGLLASHEHGLRHAVTQTFLAAAKRAQL